MKSPKSVQFSNQVTCRSYIENYRPISLLPIISKVLESIIFNKMSNFVYSRIYNHQYGFVKGRSCATQLLASYSQIYVFADQGNPVDDTFLDFRKAFHSVPHPDLLHKRWQVGIVGPLWSWFKDYLTN